MKNNLVKRRRTALPAESALVERRWQYSTGEILMVTAALAFLLGLWRIKSGLAPAYLALFFMTTLCAVLLATLVGVKSGWRAALATVVICVAFTHLIPWVMSLGALVFQEPELSLVGILPVALVALMDLRALASGSNQTTTAEAPLNLALVQRRRAAWQSLAAMGAVLFLSLWPLGPYRRGLDPWVALGLASLLFLLAVLPWFVVWYRRQSAGMVYPEALTRKK